MEEHKAGGYNQTGMSYTLDTAYTTAVANQPNLTKSYNERVLQSRERRP
jgi:hypothetical protein